jgi:transcriptional regulator with XRE-family HTH domain
MVQQIDTGPLQEVLAANLRRLRIARHLSLSELARATGMSKATLSGIENGRANPTVETLAALAEALRVSLGELLEELPLGEIRIVRQAQAAAKSDGRAGERFLEALAPGRNVDVIELSLPARHVHELGPKPHSTRAHVYVLEGKLLAGPVERITELGPGDYASFPADVPHVLEAGRHATRVLLLSENAS